MTYALLPYQQRLLSEKAPIVVVEKSRRIGVTWALALLAVLTAASSKDAGGQNVWYMVYSENDAKLFIEDCAFWARTLHGVVAEHGSELLRDAHHERSIQVRKIKFASGHNITILSSNPRVLRGKEGLLLIDEAAFLDDLGEVRKAAAAFLMWLQGRIFIVSTHNGVENPFNLLVEQIRSGGRRYSSYALHRITFDDALADGYYRRVVAKARARGASVEYSKEAEEAYSAELHKEPGASEELDCIPTGGGGVYIRRDLIRAAQSDPWPAGAAVVRIEYPKEFLTIPHDASAEERSRLEEERSRWTRAKCREVLDPILDRLPRRPCVVGGDVARFQDLTAFWLMYVEVDRRRTTRLVVELSRAPHNEQWSILDRIVTSAGARAGAIDANGLGSWLAEQAFRRYGDAWTPVRCGPEFYDRALPVLKSRFERGLISVPSDLLIEADILTIVRTKDGPRISKVRTKNSKASGTRHGDTAVAMALADDVAERAVFGPIEWASVDLVADGLGQTTGAL